MQSQHLNGLIERVQGGDVAATERFDGMLRIVLGRAVRRVLQTEDYGTPLGRRVQGLLTEGGTSVPLGPLGRADLLDSTAHQITQTICGQTVARLRSEGRSARDTVWA
jgi:hypothetical protein